MTNIRQNKQLRLHRALKLHVSHAQVPTIWHVQVEIIQLCISVLRKQHPPEAPRPQWAKARLRQLCIYLHHAKRKCQALEERRMSA